MKEFKFNCRIFCNKFDFHYYQRIPSANKVTQGQTGQTEFVEKTDTKLVFRRIFTRNLISDKVR